MFKYQARLGRYCTPEIKQVEVDKESDCFVWIKGRRVKKLGEFYSYFDSKEIAKRMIIHSITNRIDSQNKILENLQIDLRKAMEL